ncbi:actin-related protein 4 [Nadsonia fulvescens var. elongata DSM 6958]|uniref:Actin-related protein 4 n=1 Tax=Nadsonia fulvescens var. elongata DSM 6958 TaxID=857566 RepID=A0A1E3PFP9_9ASCO|nr:actin-related protein 4 [Nadsonia fulvescens var. elongata DSM 6958]
MVSSDEITSIVIEVGSSSTRAGFSGEDLPKSVIPTIYGKTSITTDDGKTNDIYDLGTSIHVPRYRKEIFSPLTDSVPHDWDAISRIWEYSITHGLKIDEPKDGEYPLMITEEVWTTPNARNKLAELAFEEFNVPAFSTVKNPLCAAYGSAKPTALVVDVGAQTTSVNAVIDGSIIPKSSLHTRFAGDFLNAHILAHLSSRNIQVVPTFAVAKRASVSGLQGQAITSELKKFKEDYVTPSFNMYEIQQVINEFKESVSQVCDTPFTIQNPLARLTRPFEFPDGFNTIFGPERLSTMEPLFRPSAYPLPGVNIPENSLGLTELIYHSVVNASDSPDVQATLLNNIVVTGGSTLLSGLANRVVYDLIQMLPTLRNRIHGSPYAIERKSAVWTGASVLASMGNFENNWVTKAEWDEFGADILERKLK